MECGLEALRRTGDDTAPINGADLAAAAKDVRSEFEMVRTDDDKGDAEIVGNLGKALSNAGREVQRLATSRNGRAMSHA